MNITSQLNKFEKSIMEDGPRLKILLILALTVLAFKLNLYKYDVIFGKVIRGGSYEIFPWSKDPQISSSSFIWLTLHITVALFHVILSGFQYIREREFGKDVVFITSHYVFMFMVLININHFGEFGMIFALILNGTPLYIMHYAYILKNMDIYFLSLISPVIFETFMYLKSNLVA